MSTPAWRRSTRCGEVTTGATVLMRDSKLGDASPVLDFDRVASDGFVAGVRAGEFAPAGDRPIITTIVTHTPRAAG